VHDFFIDFGGQQDFLAGLADPVGDDFAELFRPEFVLCEVFFAGVGRIHGRAFFCTDFGCVAAECHSDEFFGFQVVGFEPGAGFGIIADINAETAVGSEGEGR